MLGRLVIAVTSVIAIGSAAHATTQAASSSTVVTATIPSAIQLTNDCVATASWELGIVQPGGSARTATIGADVCAFDFASSNDSAQLRIAARDAQGTAMASRNAVWSEGRTSTTGTAEFAIDMFDASVVVAAGKDGMVMRTINGGTAWTTNPVPAAGDWIWDVEHVPGNNERWVAVQSNGHVVSTTNMVSSAPGNPTWTSHDAALTASGIPAGTDIYGVAVISSTTWVVVGEDGWIAKTGNTGASFTAFQESAGNWYGDVDALDANTLYAAGRNGLFSHTSLGGDNAGEWTSITHPSAASIDDISIGNSTNVYVMINSGYIARWNGSAFASSTYVGQSDYTNAVATSAASPTTVFAAGNNGTIWRSIDSGLNFVASSTATVGRLGAIDAISATTAMATAPPRTVVVTNDGTNWTTSHRLAVQPALRGIDTHPVDARRALAVGDAGQVVRTTDSGGSWSVVATGSTAMLNAVSWGSPGAVWAVGTSGTILFSSDAGLTWQPQTSGTTVRLRSVYAVDEVNAWAVGDGGTVLATRNGGVSWSPQASSTTRNLIAVTAVDRDRAWIVGDADTALRTTNGGTNWTQATSVPPGGSHLVAVVATGANTVDVVGPYTGVWRSTDGGANFTSIAPPATVGWRIIDVERAGDTIVTLSYEGRVNWSFDAGATWETTYPNVGQYHYWNVELPDPHTAYIVTDRSGIIDLDESALAAQQVSDYGGGTTWGSGGATSTFGMCLQDLSATTAAAAPFVEDADNSCVANDLSQWAGVPTNSTKVATTAGAGVTGRVEVVWGVRMRNDQPPGRYRAGIVVEALAPNA